MRIVIDMDDVADLDQLGDEPHRFVKPADDFILRHVVAARFLAAKHTDEVDARVFCEHVNAADEKALGFGALQQLQVAVGGKDGLKGEALALVDKAVAQLVGSDGRLHIVAAQGALDVVGVDIRLDDFGHFGNGAFAAAVGACKDNNFRHFIHRSSSRQDILNKARFFQSHSRRWAAF